MTHRERRLVSSAAALGAVGFALWAGVRFTDARAAALDAAVNLAECRALAARIESRRGPALDNSSADIASSPAPSLQGSSSQASSPQIPSSQNPSPNAPPSRAPQASELIHRIEAAARAAGFPPGGVERIEPAPVRRVGDGKISEKPTVVALRGVTLRQTFTFLHTVGAGRSGLQLKDLRLSAPSPDDTGDRWSVEGTLTYPVQTESRGAE